MWRSTFAGRSGVGRCWSRGGGSDGVTSHRTAVLRGSSGEWVFLLVLGGDFVGGLVAECRVESLAIVEDFDVFGNGLAGLVSGWEDGAVDEFVLQRGEEGFRQCVVPADAGAADRPGDALGRRRGRGTGYWCIGCRGRNERRRQGRSRRWLRPWSARRAPSWCAGARPWTSRRRLWCGSR